MGCHQTHPSHSGRSAESSWLSLCRTDWLFEGCLESTGALELQNPRIIWAGKDLRDQPTPNHHLVNKLLLRPQISRLLWRVGNTTAALLHAHRPHPSFPIPFPYIPSPDPHRDPASWCCCPCWSLKVISRPPPHPSHAQSQCFPSFLLHFPGLKGHFVQL